MHIELEGVLKVTEEIHDNTKGIKGIYFETSFNYIVFG